MQVARSAGTARKTPPERNMQLRVINRQRREFCMSSDEQNFESNTKHPPQNANGKSFICNLAIQTALLRSWNAHCKGSITNAGAPCLCVVLFVPLHVGLLLCMGEMGLFASESV